MNNEDLVEQFIKTEHAPEGIQVSICQIRWDGPHTPISEWKVVRELPKDAPESELHKIVLEILEDPAFFGVCSECDTRNPNGWMHSADLCQGCASDNHGVVY